MPCAHPSERENIVERPIGKKWTELLLIIVPAAIGFVMGVRRIQEAFRKELTKRGYAQYIASGCILFMVCKTKQVVILGKTRVAKYGTQNLFMSDDITVLRCVEQVPHHVMQVD